MVRVRADKFGDLRLLSFCKELNRRKLLASSHPHNILESANEHYLKVLPANVYAGFDPTSNSLHVGNLLVITNLLRSSLFGCSPIALVGGATAQIGDPSGRCEERPEMAREQVRENSKNIVKQLAEILENCQEMMGDHLRLTIVNNNDWFEKMSVLDFLRLGKSFRVGEMLRMGPIRSRMETSGISFTEFSYQIMQSFDWFMLSRNFDCFCQIGGSDQLGHLDSGADYIKRRTGRQAIGFCLPLLTDKNGIKLGKSTSSTGSPVWLDEFKTTPFALYQYYRSFHDDVAEQLLLYYSLRPLTEVEEILHHHRANLGKCIAQIALAEEIVLLVHGRSSLEKAVKCSNVLFKGSLNDFEQLDHDTISKLFAGPQTLQLSKSKTTTMAELANAVQPKGSNLVKQGAFKLNGVKITDPEVVLDHPNVLLKNRYTLISCGKRNFYLVDWRD